MCSVISQTSLGSLAHQGSFFLPTKKQLEFFSMSVGGKNFDYTIHGVPSCTCYLDFAWI